MDNKNLHEYKDTGLRILDVMESLLEEQKLTNALLRKLTNGKKTIPKLIRKDMVTSELLRGRALTTRNVMQILGVSRPIAIEYMNTIVKDKRFILKNYKGSIGLKIMKRL